MKAPFHLALPCNNIEDTRDFYINILGANPGRGTKTWQDIDLYGNQLTFTEAGSFNFNFKSYRFNGQLLPSFHFGIIVDRETWKTVYARLLKLELESTVEATFLESKAGEHLSFFLKDPNDYQIEFKSFKNAEDIFST
jgi:extradiol dioxygenase family protein